MNRSLQGAHVPDWMTKGKSTLIQKAILKETTPNNYRPITCLQMMSKTSTPEIREDIYYLLTRCGLLPVQKKGICKRSRGTAELFYTDQQILNESMIRGKNLAMALIDNKKAYDMVP